MELDHFKRLIKRKGQLGLLCEVTDNERDFFIGLILAKEMYEQVSEILEMKNLYNLISHIETLQGTHVRLYVTEKSHIATWHHGKKI